LAGSSVALLSNPCLDYRRFLVPGGTTGFAGVYLQVDESTLFYSDEESARGRKTDPGLWKKLADSKVRFALIPADRFPLSAGSLRYHAALLSGFGVSPESALRAVTVDAAEILGVADRVGSLAEGKDADLVVLNGEALDTLSRVEMVFVDGTLAWQRK
jgi:imidazolonepropionase-like amidohydrolase